MAIDYAARAARYWTQSDQAYRDGDPELGQELADVAAQCDQWAREDVLAGIDCRGAS